MQKRIKYNGEIHLFDIAFTLFEGGKYYAVTKNNKTYRLRFDLLNGVKAEQSRECRAAETLCALSLNDTEKYPFSGEHYEINRPSDGKVRITKKQKCPIFSGVKTALAFLFRLILLLSFSALAYYLFCKSNGITFAESIFPALSLKTLKILLFVLELVGALAVFFMKWDNTDVADIINCACIPLALIWGLGAVKTNMIIAVIALVILAVCIYLYVFPFVSDRIREKRSEYKRELNRDIAAQSVYALSLCLTACIFGTTLFGVVGYSDKAEYSKTDTPEVSYIEMLGDLNKWDSLDNGARLSLLGSIHSYEAKRLGIKGADVCIGYPPNENQYGAYNPITNNITINRAYFESGELLELLDTVIHETRHVYQSTLANAYTDIEDTIDEEYKSLPVFVEARAFRDNMKNYSDDYGGDYYSQPLEADAREYAKERIDGVYRRVLDNTYYFE